MSETVSTPVSLVDEDPTATKMLTQEEATARSSRISNTSYDISLSIVKGSTTYEGEVTARFRDKETAPNFLDFVGKIIHHIEINGQDITHQKGVFKGNRVHLPPQLIRSENTVKIRYTNDYNHSGDGFHQFIDPEDKQEYLFTNFEPFEAHRLFPCFDQPDIKAKYKLKVTAPKEWKVIANNPSTQQEAGDGRLLHTFKETPVFSTYLFAVVVGPYEEFVDSHTVGDKTIPLRILCRKSLVEYMKKDLDELFTITKQGFDFYTSFFDYPYPFDKYDQIWVPEFNVGAMENVGAVTFSESHVYREPATENRHASRADTVLHEMAHMWFGNLVSPVWWDGLWLNESFATYMAAYATNKATRFGDLVWRAFNRTKKWGERQDQLSTTHPIQGIVQDTDQTFLNFDGITYAKGASVIKQLVALVTEDGLREGMRYYFKKHQYSNTTITDFLEALQIGFEKVSNNKSEKVDLNSWAKVWLETAGLNTLEPKFALENGHVKEFAIIQTASNEFPTLRPHKLEVAAFKLQNGIPVLQETFFAHVSPQHKTLITHLNGKPKPDFVFINFNDHAYAKIFLDDHSISFLTNYLSALQPTLLRMMLWSTLHHMTRDAKLKSSHFLQLVRQNLPNETETQLWETVLDYSTGITQTFIPNEMFESESKKMFEFVWKNLQETKDTDRRINLAQALISFAQEQQTVEILVNLLQNGTKIEGFEFDQEMRWKIVVKSISFGLHGSEEMLLAEQKRDPSDRGQRKLAQANAAAPSKEVKAAAWNKILHDKESSSHMIAATMAGFANRRQRELLREYDNGYFDNVRSVYKERNKEIGNAFASYLYPFYPEEDVIFVKTEELLKVLEPKQEQMLERALKESLDDMKRARKCRDLEKQAKL